jgi:hypothetical protein
VACLFSMASNKRCQPAQHPASAATAFFWLTIAPLASSVSLIFPRFEETNGLSA